MPRPLLFLLLLNILCIKCSLDDVIFVRLKQNLFTVFGKYQLQYANFRSGTSLDHGHFYVLVSLNIPGIKYSVFVK